MSGATASTRESSTGLRTPHREPEDDLPVQKRTSRLFATVACWILEQLPDDSQATLNRRQRAAHPAGNFGVGVPLHLPDGDLTHGPVGNLRKQQLDLLGQQRRLIGRGAVVGEAVEAGRSV